MALKEITAWRPVVVSGRRLMEAAVNSRVEVFVAGGTFTDLAAGVTDAAGNPQPLYTDAQGQTFVIAPDGVYDVRITHADGVQAPDRLDQLWGDVKQQRDEAVGALAETLVARTDVANIATQVQTYAATAATASENAQRSSYTVATWTELAAIVPTSAGVGGEVLEADTGTHTDPVVGGTVSNAGRFSYSLSPAGWKRIGDTGLSGKADKSLIGQADGGSVLASMFLPDGKRFFVLMKSGYLDIIGLGERIRSTFQAIRSDNSRVDFSIGGQSVFRIISNGKAYLSGLSKAVQEHWSLRNDARVQKAVEQLESDSWLPRNRNFYGIDKTGRIYPVGTRSSRVTNTKETGKKLSAWAQGKLPVDSLSRIYSAYNQGSFHISSDKLPYVRSSDDKGETWAKQVPIVASAGGASAGASCWGMTCDPTNNYLYANVQFRGDTNNVGDTYYRLYRSTDRNTSWAYLCDVNAPTLAGKVPTLFHDMCYWNGWMIQFVHWDNSSRCGFFRFHLSDPANTQEFIEIIPDGAVGFPANTTVFCEGTISVDPIKDGGGVWLYGGLRTQLDSSTFSSQFFCCKAADFSSFARWAAPENVRYSPVTVKRVGNQMVSVLMERWNTGSMTLWFGSEADFYSQNSAGFFPVKVAQVIRTPITASSTQVGVQAMAQVGNEVLIAYGAERDDGSSDIYLLRFNPVRSSAYLSYEYLESL